jgi:hypothetical protein
MPAGIAATITTLKVEGCCHHQKASIVEVVVFGYGLRCFRSILLL